MASQKNVLDQLTTTMEGWFVKLPALPKEWKEVIVKITPWLALVFGLMGIFVSLIAVGVLSFLAPVVLVGSGFGRASGGVVGAVLMLVSSVLLLAAFPGTNKRKEQGWKMLFYSELVSVVSSIVAFSPVGVLGAAVGFYILFQIRSHYK